MNFSARILKGTNAEIIVSRMFKEAGYYVYSFGYENLLQNLVWPGLPRMKEGDLAAEKVRTMPDFLVMNAQGDVSFIEVKFRSGKILTELTKERIIKINKYWPEAKIIFVIPQEPYFWIAQVKELTESWELSKLSEGKFLKVNLKLISDYGNLIKKFLTKLD